MSHDPANLQVFSPTGSGRSSPSLRVTRNATEDALNKKDKSFRRYAAGVERALALWDAAQQEWADYISFLGRLLKALQSHPAETPVIPHSDTVALRLAQCLNPTLPSGVHQKALEVYAYIFSAIGKDTLVRDLNIYLPGLASVLSFASLSVRPLFLSVFENHILELNGSALRPAVKAIILSMLPGLEDETSEDFERMVTALDKLRHAVQTHPDEIIDAKSESNSSHFWQCFFLAAITNPSRRQGALAYLLRRLPRFGMPSRRDTATSEAQASCDALLAEAEAAISPEPGLLIRCFESGLCDSQLLIQRGFLDLLVGNLPLDSPVLQQRISKDDLERLVAAAAGVVFRRDMSLNRRLWAWFLGPEPSIAAEGIDMPSSPTSGGNNARADPSTYHAAYFSQNGFPALTRSVMKMINRPSRLPSDRAKPFRVCLSLMDRWEVGGLIVPEVFLPALQSIQSYSEVASKDQIDEVMRSAKTFFDGVDSGLIWGKLVYLVASSMDTSTTSVAEALKRINLAKFVLSRFNLKEEDMLFHHMPLMVLTTLCSLTRAFDHSSETSSLHEEVVEIAFEITDSLIQIIPERAIKGAPNIEEKGLGLRTSRETALRKVMQFYEHSQGSLDVSEAPFTPDDIGQILLREASHLFATSIGTSTTVLTSEMPAKIFANLVSKVQHLEAIDASKPLDLFRDILVSAPSSASRRLRFPQLCALTTVLCALQTAQPSYPIIPASQISDVVEPLVALLWQYLTPFIPKYHVEATRCILQLHTMAPSERMVEAAISAIIIQELSAKTSNNSSLYSTGRAFATLWSHTMHELSLQSEKRGGLSRRVSGHGPLPYSQHVNFQAILTRPLLLLLDALLDDGAGTAAFIRSWLQDLPSLNRVFDVLLFQLLSLRCLTASHDLNPSTAPQIRQPRPLVDDTKECLYYLKHIHNILKRPSHYTWITLAEEPTPQGMDGPSKISLQEWLMQICMKTASMQIDATETPENSHLQELHQISVAIVSQVYHSPFSATLKGLELEVPLMTRVRTARPSLQSVLLEAILSALKLRLIQPPEERNSEQRPQNPAPQRPRLSLTTTRDLDVDLAPIPPPPQLVEFLKFGFSSNTSRLVLDDWVRFLVEVLPLFADTIFQNLLPLVECFCKQINQTFVQLQTMFANTGVESDISPESTLISLVNGLEQILAKAHDRLTIQETRTAANKSPEQPQGFFGNMVSGVFSSETNQTRTPTANTRLTVLLCFQDTVRICFSVWSWGGYGPKDGRHDPASASSFGYTSLRMRNRARRILEHLFAAEALECLETLVVLWTQSLKDDNQATAIIGLLNVLNGSKPKHTIPAIFNAVYSRTNPNALDPHRMSTLTSDLSDTDLVSFLVDYTKSLEDDAMDEIWQDCTLFLRDVLANPLPNRQILPILLEFTAVIGRKVDNTNFGEQRKMRKELADIFTRILTAVFTTRSMGFLQDPSQATAADKPSAHTNGILAHRRAVDVVSILNSIVPYLPIILLENERVTAVVTTISNSVIGPTFRAKAFPDNVSKGILDLLQALAKVAQANKFWKKDLYDAFNDPRFFSTPLPLFKESWLPILAQWTHSDKERLLELLSRLSAPTTAGIMFGVGATSARQEADRKTQLTLRRIALLVLASPEDTFTPAISAMMEKLVELLTATPASSPSSTTRSEVLILLRALILKTSSIHLAPLWPVINSELTSALSSLLPNAANKEHYTNSGIIQACKLLDQLVVLDPDDFQLIEWLYISDTIDAVYKPTTSSVPISLADEIAEVLSQTATPSTRTVPPLLHRAPQPESDEEPKRSLFLDPLIDALEKEEGAEVTDMARRELVDRVVRPFLGNLAMVAFESTYSGAEKDWEGAWASTVKDARIVD